MALAASLLGLAALSAALLTRLAMRISPLDVPNARSSHARPTPRGGGIAIVATCTVGFVALLLLDMIGVRLALVLLIGGTVVAVTSYVDDHRGVAPGWRLLAQLVAAILAAGLLGWDASLPGAEQGFAAQSVRAGATVLGIVWFVNLFNFMDGTDGLAASEAAFVALAGGVLTMLIGTALGTHLAAAVVAGASFGFLVWNWAPAKIFMGDVGSAYLGFVIAVLGVSAAGEHPAGLLLWLSLAVLFVVDASITLLRRLLRGDSPFKAHRTHAYQWLARRRGGHRSVAVHLWLFNLAAVLPIAVLEWAQPFAAVWLTALLYLLATGIVLAAGAGRRDTGS